MPTIAQLEARLAVATQLPREFFGTDVDTTLKEIQGQAHPDRFSTDSDRARADEIFRLFGVAAEKAKEPPVTITTKSRTYTLGKLIATGDVSDVYAAICGTEHYTLKISRVVGADKLLAHEYFPT